MKWPAAKGALYTVVMAGKQSTIISNATFPLHLLVYPYQDHSMVPLHVLVIYYDTNRS